VGGNIWCGSATQAHANFGDWRVRSRSAPANSVPCEACSATRSMARRVSAHVARLSCETSQALLSLSVCGRSSVGWDHVGTWTATWMAFPNGVQFDPNGLNGDKTVAWAAWPIGPV